MRVAGQNRRSHLGNAEFCHVKVLKRLQESGYIVDEEVCIKALLNADAPLLKKPFTKTLGSKRVATRGLALRGLCIKPAQQAARGHRSASSG